MGIEKKIKALHNAEDLEFGSIRILNEIKAAYREIEQERDKLRAQLKACEGSPSELEMHRADYNAIKAAGFESPGELLAAYKVAQEREPVIRVEGGKVTDFNPNYSGNLDGDFYAAPVPAQQSSVVAVDGKSNDRGEPEALYLQLHGEEFESPADFRSGETTWCWEKIHDQDVRYIRADLVQKSPAAAVPDEMKRKDFHDDEMEKCYDSAYASGWNACRRNTIEMNITKPSPLITEPTVKVPDDRLRQMAVLIAENYKRHVQLRKEARDRCDAVGDRAAAHSESCMKMALQIFENTQHIHGFGSPDLALAATPAASQSPRITEQTIPSESSKCPKIVPEHDAREIVDSVIRYCNTRPHVAWDTESYMREQGGQLLEKLSKENGQ